MRHATRPDDNTDFLQLFKPVEIARGKASRLGEDICSINTDRGQISFSAAFGNTIRDYKYLVCMENSITKEYAFLFTKKNMSNAFPLNFKSDDCGYFKVSGKGLTQYLQDKLGVSAGGHIKMGPNVSKNPDVILRMIESVD